MPDYGIQITIENNEIKGIKNETMRHVKFNPIGGKTDTIILNTEVNKLSGSKINFNHFSLNLTTVFRAQEKDDGIPIV